MYIIHGTGLISILLLLVTQIVPLTAAPAPQEQSLSNATLLNPIVIPSTKLQKRDKYGDDPRCEGVRKTFADSAIPPTNRIDPHTPVVVIDATCTIRIATSIGCQWTDVTGKKWREGLDNWCQDGEVCVRGGSSSSVWALCAKKTDTLSWNATADWITTTGIGVKVPNGKVGKFDVVNNYWAPAAPDLISQIKDENKVVANTTFVTWAGDFQGQVFNVSWAISGQASLPNGGGFNIFVKGTGQKGETTDIISYLVTL